MVDDTSGERAVEPPAVDLFAVLRRAIDEIDGAEVDARLERLRHRVHQETRSLPTQAPVTRTPEQRAAWALARACNGWRRDHICRDQTGKPKTSPHRGCLRAQQEHDQILRDAVIPDLP